MPNISKWHMLEQAVATKMAHNTHLLFFWLARGTKYNEIVVVVFWFAGCILYSFIVQKVHLFSHYPGSISRQDNQIRFTPPHLSMLLESLGTVNRHWSSLAAVPLVVQWMCIAGHSYCCCFCDQLRLELAPP